jgi:hypothetical protein
VGALLGGDLANRGAGDLLRVNPPGDAERGGEDGPDPCEGGAAVEDAGGAVGSSREHAILLGRFTGGNRLGRSQRRLRFRIGSSLNGTGFSAT